MNRILTLAALFLALLATAASFAPTAGWRAAANGGTANGGNANSGNDERAAVEEAILQAARLRDEKVLAFLVYDVVVDEVRFSADGQWALATLGMADRQTGEPLPVEPGLALAHKEGETWVVVLQADDNWATTVLAVPDDLLTAAGKQEWLGQAPEAGEAVAITPSDGYYLPWSNGDTIRLTRSLAHDVSFPTGSAHFSFDFASNAGMFDVRAAKGGIVWMWDDHWENGHYNPSNSGEANYLVIKDESTSPASYQLYLHLAQYSIPSGLKSQGAPVSRGQLIGVADDTGWSTGHHLHYQVHTCSTCWYSTAVDIQFEEVAINGGRPRADIDIPYCQGGDVCNSTSTSYTSANVYLGDATPPNGSLDGLSNGAVIPAAALALNGTAADGQTGLYVARFIANWDGTWRDVGPLFTASPLTYNWDWCAAGVPDGLVSLSVKVTDNAGNTAWPLGLTHVIKDYACPTPPPACTPSANQAALFENAEYSGCVLFEIGDYPNLSTLGDNDAAALKLGSNVALTLFADTNYTGRRETFFAEDNNLADNRIGADAASAMKVFLRPALPSAPVLHSPAAGASIPAGDLVPLFWLDGGGALEYQLAISEGVTTTLTGWQASPLYFLETSATTGYQWQARARSEAGEGPWSELRAFSVITATNSQPTFNAPYSDNIEGTETRWLVSGLWRLVDDAALALSDPHAWWYNESDGDYDTGAPSAGGLTSPFISIPTSQYYLRFYYRYETESNRTGWDQRWVQISANNGPFRNVWQLSDDPKMGDTSSWLQSKPIPLAAYAGQTIRVRFYFDTLDAANNDFRGWGIDDFSITATAPAACSDAQEPNDTPASAAPIAIGQTLSAFICANGDLDYYVFSGSAGQRLSVDVDAQSIGSSLDSYLYLLGGDGAAVLAEHDDEIYSVQKDSRLVFTLPASGAYYLKVRDWKHPANGGSAYAYNLGLYEDSQHPQITFVAPPSGSYLSGVETLQATASDAGSGLARVEFFWHDADWREGVWESLGSDSSSAGGWSLAHDFSAEADQRGGALFANAFDRAGNSMGAGAWEIAVDNTPPVSALQPLAATQPSNAIRVTWTGSDALSGLASFDLQWMDNGGAGWLPLASPAGGETAQWVVGEPGSAYGFRLRALDAAGNIETYPAGAETSTTIPFADQLCGAPDSFEDDNAPIAATLALTGSLTTHNFCNPQAADWQGDEDWLTFSAVSGVEYFLLAAPLDQSAAAQISLFAADGTTLLAEASAADFGIAAALRWRAGESGMVFVRLRHNDSRVIGAGYTFRVQLSRPVFLPVVWK